MTVISRIVNSCADSELLYEKMSAQLLRTIILTYHNRNQNDRLLRPK